MATFRQNVTRFLTKHKAKIASLISAVAATTAASFIFPGAALATLALTAVNAAGYGYVMSRGTVPAKTSFTFGLALAATGFLIAPQFSLLQFMIAAPVAMIGSLFSFIAITNNFPNFTQRLSNLFTRKANPADAAKNRSEVERRAQLDKTEEARLQAKALADEAKAAKEVADKVKAEKEAAEKAKAKQEAAEKAKAEQEAAEKAKAEQEAAEKAKAEQEAAEKAKAEQEAAEKAKAEQEAAEKAKAEQEAAEKAKAEQEAAEKAKAEQEAAEKAKAEQEAAEKAKAEQEAAEKAKAEQEAAEKAKAEQEAAEKAKAEQEAAERAKAEQEAAEKAKAEQEAAERAQALAAAAQTAANLTTEDELHRSLLDALEAPRSPQPAASPSFLDAPSSPKRPHREARDKHPYARNGDDSDSEAAIGTRSPLFAPSSPLRGASPASKADLTDPVAFLKRKAKAAAGRQYRKPGQGN